MGAVRFAAAALDSVSLTVVSLSVFHLSLDFVFSGGVLGALKEWRFLD